MVIYDGECRFCRGQVARLARWDTRGKLAFISAHDPEAARRYPDLSHEQLMQQMYVVDPQGKRHAGAGAFRYLSRKLPRLWLLAPWLHIPGTLPLWQWMYRQVAKRRYRWNKAEVCDDQSCQIHYR